MLLHHIEPPKIFWHVSSLRNFPSPQICRLCVRTCCSIFCVLQRSWVSTCPIFHFSLVIILLCIRMVHSSWVRTCFTFSWFCSVNRFSFTLVVVELLPVDCLSVLVNTSFLEHGHTPTFICIAYGCFHIITVELSSCDRNLWPARLKILVWSFIKRSLPTPDLLCCHFISIIFTLFPVPSAHHLLFVLLTLSFACSHTVFIWTPSFTTLALHPEHSALKVGSLSLHPKHEKCWPNFYFHLKFYKSAFELK